MTKGGSILMPILYLEARITWVGQKIPKYRRWFATLSSEAFGLGHFCESRRELIQASYVFNKQAAFDSVNDSLQYPNCSVRLTEITQAMFATATANDMDTGTYIESILDGRYLR